MKMSKSNDNKISKILMSKMASHLLFPIAKIYSCCEPLSSGVLCAWTIGSRSTFCFCVNLLNLVLKGLWDEHLQQQESGPRLKSAFPFEEILKEILLSYINPSCSYIDFFLITENELVEGSQLRYKCHHSNISDFDTYKGYQWLDSALVLTLTEMPFLG